MIFSILTRVLLGARLAILRAVWYDCRMDQKTPAINPPDLSKKIRPLAIALLSDIQAGVIDPKELTTEKKTLCVQFMILQQSYTVIEMATLLQVDRSTIYNYKKKLYQENAISQLVIDESTIALELIETAQHSSAKLMSEKKYKDAWTVRKECLEMLQTMGYVKKVEQKLNVKGQIDILSILNADLELREQSEESPENDGDENGTNGHSHGSGANGNAGPASQGGARMEPIS